MIAFYGGIVKIEIFADAYAGINAFGSGVSQWTEAVHQKMDELYVGKAKLQDNGTRQTNGPNETEKNTAREDGEEDWLTVSDEEFEERYGRLKPGAAFERKDAESAEKYSQDEYIDDADMTAEELAEGKAIADFIDKVNAMLDESARSKRKLRVGRLSNNHAMLIEKLMDKIQPGFSAAGYELWIDGTGASHIEKRHGAFGKQDRSMANKEAKMLIPWASQNAERCSFLLDEKGNIKKSKRFLNSDGTRAPEISMEKTLNNDTVCVSECVPDSRNKKIWITSAYIKKGSTGQKLNMEETSPQPTPEAIFDSSATKDIVTLDGDDVKHITERFSVDDSVDSDGNELSAEQQEYFRDSKVRDDQGRLMVMYHGTPNGNHTTFRSGTYFTPDRQYADVYQGLGASSLSVKRDASNPKTYQVYLNIEKPFDTRNPKERRIFMQEYYRQWGTGAPLANSGLPDWTDGMDLQEFIEEMGYDYDGLILDEGATGGYDLEVKSRGLSYLIFSSEQAKNVDNRKPTDNPDIRYSVDDASTEDYDALDAEFAARQREAKETFLRERLGDKGYEQYLHDRKQQAQQQKEDNRLREETAPTLT